MSKAVQRTLEAKLAALEANPDGDSSSDEEGSDDELMETVKDTSSRKSTLRSSKRDVAKKESGAASSVIYIGHLPRGFEEHELRQLLKQFGKVVKLRLVRSKRTGNSRGYAFCQFPTPEIAAIVSETFSGYLVMGQHRLVCHVIASDRVHRGLFQKLPVLLTMKERRELYRKEANQPRTASKMSQITAGLLQREQKKRNKLKAMGIDYFDAFPGFEGSAKSMGLKSGSEATASSNSAVTKGDGTPKENEARVSSEGKKAKKSISTSKEEADKSSSNKKALSKSPSSKSANDNTKDNSTKTQPTLKEVLEKSKSKVEKTKTSPSPKPEKSKRSQDKQGIKRSIAETLSLSASDQIENTRSSQRKQKENSVSLEANQTEIKTEALLSQSKPGKCTPLKKAAKGDSLDKKRKEVQSSSLEAAGPSSAAKRRKAEFAEHDRNAWEEEVTPTHKKQSKESNTDEKMNLRGAKKNKMNNSNKKRRQSAP